MKYFVLFLLGIIIHKVYLFFFKDDSSEKYIQKIISKLTFEELPELIKGKTGFANNIGVNIFFEDIKPIGNHNSTVILINGFSDSLLHWPKDLVRVFIKNKIRVIKFDNRDCGMSDWSTDIDSPKTYSLNDMAQDTLTVCSKLGVENFHVIGYSMGGMISQILAINYPEKILSLTCLMSSGHLFDPESENPNKNFSREVRRVKLGFNNIKNEFKKELNYHFKLSSLFSGKGSYILDLRSEIIKSIYEITKRKGYNKEAYSQHKKAVKRSGSRYNKLKKIKTSTLLIHGSNDPFIPVSHSKKMANLIHGCKFEIINGAGHDLNKNFKNRINSIILPHILRNS